MKNNSAKAKNTKHAIFFYFRSISKWTKMVTRLFR